MEPPYFEPGSTWYYSNTNYIVPGMICEAVTNAKISDEFRNRFYDSLNLSSTFLDVEDTLTGFLAHAWVDTDNDGMLEDISSISRTASYSTAWAGGAILSTAEDIAMWTKYLIEGNVVNHQTCSEMLNFYPVTNFIPYYTGCGLGVWRMQFYDRELWGHGGGGLGYTGLSIYSPSDSIVVTVLVNQNRSVAEIVADLLEVTLDYITSLEDNFSSKPVQFELGQNYPNPFNSTTQINYSVNQPGHVSIIVYDVLGSVIGTVVNEYKSIGMYRLEFNGSDLTTGIYLYQMRMNGFVRTKKMILLR